MSTKLVKITSVGSVVIDLLLITFSTVARYYRKIALQWDSVSGIYITQESLWLS